MIATVPPSLGGVDKTLNELLARAAAGEFPPPDGGVTVLAQQSPRDAGVIAFTGHNVVFADVDAGWVRGLLPDDVAAPLAPPFLLTLAERLGRKVNSVDMLTVAPARPGPPPASPPHFTALTEITSTEHPRVRRAQRFRDGLRIWEGGGAVVMIGRGVAGRWEVAVEVDPGCQGRGLGRAAIGAARHLVPGGEPLWAQIAPGNAASVRAFLAADFVPVGAEVLLPWVVG
ncbi:MAG TPA: GNAT family N-acetyltransferase [Streptosporangiaceae bacterium]|jgi:RimJ/RimL family protein N-acetyltransferase|nr:GNAT family N-acetyltransferase [Streptosporangiaceae bacterium]